MVISGIIGLLCGFIMMNAMSAGLAAVLFGWGRGLSFAKRTWVASTAFALVFTLMVILVSAVEDGVSSIVSGEMPVVLVVILLVSSLLSLPGALIVGRRLERLIVDTRTFA